MSCWAALPCPLSGRSRACVPAAPGAGRQAEPRTAGRSRTHRDTRRPAQLDTNLPDLLVELELRRGHGIGGQKENLDLVHDCNRSVATKGSGMRVSEKIIDPIISHVDGLSREFPRLLADLHRRLDANHGVTGSWLRFPVFSVRSWRTPWD